MKNMRHINTNTTFQNEFNVIEQVIADMRKQHKSKVRSLKIEMEKQEENMNGC